MCGRVYDVCVCVYSNAYVSVHVCVCMCVCIERYHYMGSMGTSTKYIYMTYSRLTVLTIPVAPDALLPADCEAETSCSAAV